MPELPEVEVTRRGLLGGVVGGRILDVQDHGRKLRYPYPDWSLLAGRKIYGLERRAKYLLFRLEGNMTLVWHLGMSGHFRCLPRNAPSLSHEQVAVHLGNGHDLRYCDPRRFGYVGLIPDMELDAHPWFRRLGPEPFSAQFSQGWLADQSRLRRCSIKQLLMDGRVVVGVGNIYACEALFRSGIHPARAACRISRQRLTLLWNAVRQVLAEAIEAGGSSIRDFRHGDGRLGYFVHAFRVYGREGQPCIVCGQPIRRMLLNGRGTFYCGHCQR